MQVQVNTDDHVPGRDDMEREIEALMTSELDRFADQVTRVEVHLSDVNAAKLGDRDKRCLIELRVAGKQPIAVSHQASAMRPAIDGATDKAVRALDTVFGKMQHRKGAETIRRDELPPV